MWVKRTKQELRELELKKKRDRPRAAIFVGIFVFCLGLFLKSDGETMLHLVSRWEIPAQIFPALVGGVLVGLLFYFFPIRNRPVIICDRCGKSKDKDSEPKCSCGGTFEDIQTMKRQDDA